MRRIFLCMALFLAFFYALIPFAEAERQTINIGFVQNTVDETVESRKLLRAYTASYLDEITRKTKWRYAIKDIPPEDAKRMLEEGSVDFIVPVTESSAARGDGFIFSSGFSSYGLLSLYTGKDNTALDVEDKKTMQGCRIGMLDIEDYKIKFSYIVKKSEWDVRQIFYPDSEQMMKDLRAGVIDAVLDDGSHIIDNERWLLDIDVVQQQFMTVSDKRSLMDEMNNAILDSEILNPSFETEIEKEYLDPVLRHIVRYTENDRAYAEEAPTLRVVFMPYVPPLFDLRFEKGEPWGIYVDLLKTISRDTGLRFEFIEAKDEDEADRMMRDGEVDLIPAVYQNFRVPEGAAFTNTARNEAFVLVVRRGISLEDCAGGMIAVPRIFPGVVDFMKQRFPDSEIVEYNLASDCMKAVEFGDVTCAFVPAALIHYYSSTALRPDIDMIYSARIKVPVGIGVSPYADRRLLPLLNTALLRVSPEQMEHIIEKNSEPEVSVRYIVQKYPISVTLVVMIFSFLLGLGVFILYRAKEEKKQNAVLREKNRAMEEALARIRSLKEARDYYKQDAETDKLTGLLNKGTLHEEAKKALSEMSKKDSAILFITDLDHFKELNDSEGHQCGDEVLAAYAGLLGEIFPQAKALGRFGGDEFMGLLVNMTREEFLAGIKRLMTETRKIIAGGKNAGVSVSIGAVEALHGHRRYSEIFNEADQELYAVKNSTRDALSFDGKMYRF
ncbi:diguanylate cyclase domain-containing protein [Schwartzia succinivorans]|uniref:Diguanylate cyclase (GGDEF) domain-containing protein n=1 Tax=Schwartzia succinivorans DSM 10502 TaxID=1123243 RepID=A0A1M5ABT6_9FIRM|nr:diguanylate cyclase [Schwartzia succinivorans]SHF27604.1 diguanylate cyclase (GGDEF) domain-containing protein [Schwartzia succinivorans DSM 10502]